MFNRLQKKWGVSLGRLLLILCTFAIGGSLTGWIGKKIMALFDITTPWLFVPVYLVVITLIWPLMVLVVSIPFGQFTFFRNYLRRLGRRLAGKNIHHADRT